MILKALPTLLLLLLSSCVSSTAMKQPPVKIIDDVVLPIQASLAPAPDWTRIESARLIFTAVSEGLQEEPLDDELLAVIVPNAADGRLVFESRFFIWGCPLCHPAFEAFRAQRLHPKRFVGLDRNTLSSSNLSADFRSRLLHSSAIIQRNAVEELVTVWVKRHLDRCHYSDTKLKTLQKDFELGQAEALRLIIQARDALKSYDRGSCPICQGSIGAGMLKLR
jgi:hypothetical protein